jgi:hypothetical protein
MASPMPQGGMANALLRPAEGPTRFGGVAAPTGPQLPAGALRLPPPAAPAAPVAPAAPPAAPLTGFEPQPVPEEERVSVRAPVPKADFPEKHHKHLHDHVMGEAFDDPGAQDFVRDIYSIVRKSRPYIHPRHLLETVRDAWHAVNHGFMPPEMAGGTIGDTAHRRQVEAGGRHPADEPER